MLAGLALDWIGFPENATPGSVPPEVVRNLAILYGPGMIAVLAIGAVYFARYQLTGDRVAEMQRKLAERRAGGG
jgi:glycoside/pentoside/hexuronide:cation symporter, GPH family